MTFSVLLVLDFRCSKVVTVYWYMNWSNWLNEQCHEPSDCLYDPLKGHLTHPDFLIPGTLKRFMMLRSLFLAWTVWLE